MESEDIQKINWKTIKNSGDYRKCGKWHLYSKRKIPTLLFYILLMTGVNGENILMGSNFLNTFKVEIEWMQKYQFDRGNLAIPFWK